MWPPTSPEELENYLREGDAQESHHIDFKRQISTKADKRTFAEHMASFATDGGWLVIGVDEADGSFNPAPFNLDGAAEQVEQVAHTRIDPPLYIETSRLPYSDGSGYLLVRIPPSPHVVHSVDFKYWGRGDKMKIRLGDADVERRMLLRTSRIESSRQVLAERVSAYPALHDNTRVRPRLLARASPRTARPTPLREVVAPHNIQAVQQLLNDAEEAYLAAFHDGDRSQANRPWLVRELVTHFPRPGGRALVSGHVTPEGTLSDDVTFESGLVEVRVLESGAVEVWWEKQAGTAPGTFRPSTANDDDVVAAAALATALAVESSAVWNFDGTWDLGVRIERPHGVVAMTGHRGPADPSHYPGKETYEEFTTFTPRQAQEHLASVTEALVGGFLRALHTHGRFFP